MSQRLDYVAAAPDGMKALGQVRAYVAACGLPADFVELVNLRVSHINGCAFCIDMHARELTKAGVPIEKILLVAAWQEAGNVFTQRERAAFAWADTVTLVHETTVPDEAFVEASREFSDKELADLTIVIGLMNAYNRLAVSFRTPPRAAKKLRAAE